MKQSMNEKDERIEGFEENMKLRETELIEVYRNDSNPVSDRSYRQIVILYGPWGSPRKKNDRGTKIKKFNESRTDTKSEIPN